MEVYKLDDSGRHVKLQVDVGTSGIAVTTVFLSRNGTNELTLESASLSGGDIPFAKIGINRKLKETELDISVAIDLRGIPNDKWQDEIDNVLNVVSTIKGGPDGEVNFDMKGSEIDSSDLPDVFVDKQIEIR